MQIIKRLWQWPDGLVWKATEPMTIRSRKSKYNVFIKYMFPSFQDTILDVGVSNHMGRATNFLELWYPYSKNITALGVGSRTDYQKFIKHFPEVNLITGDGRKIDFPDNYFDIVFSNAVVEHVGSTDEQKRFIQEIVRVSRRAFITTPNYWFPIDFHTLRPLAHYLPLTTRFWLYRKAGREYFADLNHLNLLTARRFQSLFPKGIKLTLIKQRILGLTSSLIAIINKDSVGEAI